MSIAIGQPQISHPTQFRVQWLTPRAHDKISGVERRRELCVDARKWHRANAIFKKSPSRIQFAQEEAARAEQAIAAAIQLLAQQAIAARQRAVAQAAMQLPQVQNRIAQFVGMHCKGIT